MRTRSSGFKVLSTLGQVLLEPFWIRLLEKNTHVLRAAKSLERQQWAKSQKPCLLWGLSLQMFSLRLRWTLRMAAAVEQPDENNTNVRLYRLDITNKQTNKQCVKHYRWLQLSRNLMKSNTTMKLYRLEQTNKQTNRQTNKQTRGRGKIKAAALQHFVQDCSCLVSCLPI